MIARILYREGVEGPLSYVIKNSTAKVLGYHNFVGNDKDDITRFKNTLNFLGHRNDNDNRFAHIMLNLPRNEKLDEKKFNLLAKLYMTEMGYGDQPFIVVEHTDKEHQHVHIISTTIKEDNSMVDLWQDRTRSFTVQRKLEKSFGLSLSPEHIKGPKPASSEGERILPASLDNDGVRFFIQDHVQRTVKNHRPRNAEHLAALLTPIGITFRQTVSKSNRKGAIFGLVKDSADRYRNIYGSRLGKDLTGPKLEKLFSENRKSKNLVRKRIIVERHLKKTLAMYSKLSAAKLADTVKTVSGLRFVPEYDGTGRLKDYVAIDVKGEIFQAKEMRSLPSPAKLNLKLVDGPNVTDIDSDELKNTLRTVTKKYLKRERPKNGNGYSSYAIDSGIPNAKEVVEALFNDELIGELQRSAEPSEKRLFAQLAKEVMRDAIQHHIKGEKQKVLKALTDRERLLKLFVDKQVVSRKDILESANGLGIIVDGNGMSMSGAGDISIPDPYRKRGRAHINKLPFPLYSELQYRTWDHLIGESNNGPDNDLTLFLPLHFPGFYDNLKNEHRQGYDRMALNGYINNNIGTILKKNIDVGDNIRSINHKGFYLIPVNNGTAYAIKSVYTGNTTSDTLSPDIMKKLGSNEQIGRILRGQQQILSPLIANGQNTLEHLWTTHLIERKIYNSAAYRIAAMGYPPNMEADGLKVHMERGLADCLKNVKKIGELAPEQVLRSFTYYPRGASSSSATAGAAYNAFKDELTDYSAMKKQSVSIKLL